MKCEAAVAVAVETGLAFPMTSVWVLKRADTSCCWCCCCCWVLADVTSTTEASAEALDAANLPVQKKRNRIINKGQSSSYTLSYSEVFFPHYQERVVTFSYFPMRDELKLKVKLCIPLFFCFVFCLQAEHNELWPLLYFLRNTPFLGIWLMSKLHYPVEFYSFWIDSIHPWIRKKSFQYYWCMSISEIELAKHTGKTRFH